MDQARAFSSNEMDLLLQQQELLDYLLEEEGEDLSQERKIVPREQAAATPLSFAQQRLWFIDQFEPGFSLYNIPVACRLYGKLERTALEQSLRTIVARHEILRTTFDSMAGQPIQIVAEQMDVPLHVHDLCSFSSKSQETRLLDLLKTEAQRPFDLLRGPLLHAHLIQLTELEHVLLLVVHHIVIDEWSIRLLLQELITSYSAMIAEEPANLPVLPIQYADYALWQREWLQGEVLQQELSYWHTQLADLPYLQLPTDYARPVVQSYQGGHVHFMFPPALANQLKALSQQEGVTLFMVLLASFKILLARYCQQKDIVVGTSIANRSQAELANLIGFCVNTLVLRTDLTGNPTCKELIARVREVTSAAYDHQELPFEQVVEAVQPERSAAQQAVLFQAMLVLHNAPLDQVKMADLILEPLIIDRDMSELEMGFDFFDTEQGLMGEVEYRADLFAETTIRHMVAHLQVILEAMVADPSQRIDTLSLLTLQESQQMLVEWNATGSINEPFLCAHEAIEQQVARTPEAIAAVFKDQRLTFRELNEQANQLAHYLRAHGVRPEMRVGICVEHSLAMLVSMLAVIKAGGAYVPLDPTYPQDRLDFMVEDAQITALLTQQQFVDKFQTYVIPQICIDSEQQQIASCSTTNVHSGVTPENLIYIIYTSGSTGLPKGVMIAHAHLMNMFYVWNATYHLDTVLRAHLQMSSFSVDLFICDAIQTLCTGAKLVMCPHDDVIMPERLYALMRREGVNSGEFVPAVLKGLTEYVYESGQRLDFMDIIVAGADSWHASNYRMVKELSGPQTRVINGYGSTEVTIDSTYFEERPEQPVRDGVVPLGRPFPDAEIYLLDAAWQPVPLGIVGEIYIGGKRLGRGYLNRPALTAERFIPHPFSHVAGARLYRTGDLGRYRDDGVIEFLGRADYQVKIRGFRIELGEIEATLKDQPTVQEAVVLVYEKIRPEDKRLVAYVVPSNDIADHALLLRGVLRERLPYYMVPSEFLFLSEIPLNATGKLDRRALPKPDLSDAPDTDAHVAPRNPVEEVVAAIWSKVLSLDFVGIYDNFFERGGHSLLATQLISRVGAAFSIDFPLRTLFEEPTIAAMAAYIQQLQTTSASSHMPVLKPRESTDAPELSFAQQRLWFLDQFEAQSAFYNMPAALLLEGLLDVRALQDCLNEVVRRHKVLRTTFALVDGQSRQVIASRLELALPVIDLRQYPEQESWEKALNLAQAEAEKVFDLEQGPLVRATLVQLQEQKYLFLFTMHHIVSDGWSIEVLIHELSSLYEAFTQGQSSPLSPLTVQYTDYALWQREWLQGDMLQSEFAYWRQQLAGAPALLNLPTDHPRPAVQRYRGTLMEFQLSAELSTQLQELSRRFDATLFMTLLAAFQILLMRYSGQEDISVGTPIANRMHPALENLIGCFVNTLVLRTNLTGDPRFCDLLAKVREVCLEAHTHQNVPFEQVVEALQPERDMSYTPLFQVLFILHNTPESAFTLKDITLTPLPLHNGTAKFDLSLALQESSHGLSGTIEYNTDLFELETITRMLEHFQVLLNAIVATPLDRLSALPLLTEKEAALLLQQDVLVDGVQLESACVHQLFEQQVQATPTALAVTYGDEQLTYEELDRQANRLARYLQQAGVGPDVRVGICIPRSIEMVVAVLAILKAGGAYVPLDPDYPFERVCFMVEDAQVQLVLAQSQEMERFSGFTGKGLDTQDIRPHVESFAPEPLSLTVVPENLAYVIYTSGSTGRPKGIAMPHVALANLLEWQSGGSCATIGTKTLQFTSLSFDVSFQEIFSTWCTGGTLVLISSELRQDFDALLRFVQDKSIERFFLPVVALQQLALIAIQRDIYPEALREIITAGEQLRINDAIVQWLSRLPKCQLLNHYGPAETHVVTTFPLTSDPEQWPALPPIGRAVTNVQVYVLDNWMRLVPAGVVGNLYVGGVQVARGYLDRGDLTAERFVPDPFSLHSGARLYKTGDLVRYKGNGLLEFLGRADAQIKMRGYRIEMAEIETVLNQHPAVYTGVVALQKDKRGEGRLVAYVVPEAEQILLSVDELRAYLKRRLPEYMLPAMFLLVDELPLNSNGKVDRMRLPTIEWERTGMTKTFVAPRSIVEEVVAACWSDVLGIEQIGVHDNYFALGGHSLLATQIIARLREIFQIDLPLRSLFETATVAGLVEQMAQMAGGADVMEMIAQTYKELEALSEDEVSAMLAGEQE